MRQIDIYTNYLYTCKINKYIYIYYVFGNTIYLYVYLYHPKFNIAKKRWFLKLAPFNYGYFGVSM